MTETNRRGLLKGAGVAAGAVSLGLLDADPAQAANPPLLLDQSNASTYTTTVASGGVLSTTFSVTNGYSQGNALYGQAFGASAIAVYADAGTGTALYGYAQEGICLNAAGSGRIVQNPQSTAGAPSDSTQRRMGEQIRDKNGALYLCTAAGQPGTWERAATVRSGYSGGAWHALPHPVRLLDTRAGKPANAATKGLRANGSVTTVTVAGFSYDGVTIPPNATLVIGNLTAIVPSGDGYLTLYPHGQAKPTASNLNYTSGITLSNAFTSGVGANQVDLAVSGGSCHLVLDVSAFVI